MTQSEYASKIIKLVSRISDSTKHILRLGKLIVDAENRFVDFLVGFFKSHPYIDKDVILQARKVALGETHAPLLCTLNVAAKRLLNAPYRQQCALWDSTVSVVAIVHGKPRVSKIAFKNLTQRQLALVVTGTRKCFHVRSVAEQIDRLENPRKIIKAETIESLTDRCVASFSRSDLKALLLKMVNKRVVTPTQLENDVGSLYVSLATAV